MDAQEHAKRVAKVEDWFAQRVGHAMSVTVVTGEQTEYVATGPFLRLEEHPTSRGVFRALFDDSLTQGSGPGSEKFVAFGSELVGVETSDERLVLDKGAQRIEVVDRSAVVPTSDQVAWEESAPVRQPTSGMPSAGPVTAPVTVPPPAQPPVSYADELAVRAPVWGNSLNGSKFSGTVKVSVHDGVLSVTGIRSANGGGVLVSGGLMLVFGAMGLAFGLVIAFQAQNNSDMGMAFACMGSGLLLLLPGLVMYLVGRRRAMEGQVSTYQVNLADIRGAKVRYDSNGGCLLALVLTPIVGLIYILVQGKRMAMMTVPNDRGSSRRMNLVLKTFSSADGARLAGMLRR